MNSGSKKAWLLRGATASAILWSGTAMAQERTFDVPSESAVQAIPEFGRQAGIQMVAPAQELRGITTPAIKGSLEVRVALHQMLAGTGIQIASDDGQTVILKAPPKNVQAASNDGAASQSDSQTLETVIVSAEKTDERMMDVPMSVSAINADTLTQSGETRLRDYFSRIPNLNLTGGYEAMQSLTIRGISTGSGAPTVGVTIDDVPFGIAGASFLPDVDPGDLARLEVLRGPQGTFYGANSMGGLLKYVTKDPTTDGLSGRIEVGTDSVSNGSEPGFQLRGSANIPLSDTLAIRVSAFDRQDAGYIDNPVLNHNGVNLLDAVGGKIAVLWLPTDNLSIKLSAIYQDTNAKGNSDVEVLPGLGDLQQAYVPRAGQDDHIIQAYIGTLNYTLGNILLTSVTGYTVNRFTNWLDYTSFAGSLPATFGVSGAVLDTHHDDVAFTQEVRATVPITDNLEWVVGGFYSNASTGDGHQYIYAENATTGQIAGQLAYIPFPEHFFEFAGFTNLTYHVTDRFDLELGGRDSQTKQNSLATTYVGPLFGASNQSIFLAQGSNSNAFTYSASAKYKISSDLMTYARISTGYRPGGPNTAAPGVTSQYGPDKTTNYEVGLKGGFFDGRLTVDGSLYYIDWSKIQLTVTTPLSFKYIANGGEAKSEGGELSIEAHPLESLTVGGWIAYTDAVLTQNFQTPGPLYGKAGDKLPYSSPFSANAWIRQEFPLLDAATTYIEGDFGYVDTRSSLFEPTAVRTIFPAYTKEDIRLGANFDTWSANLYVENIGDKRGEVGGGIGYRPANAFTYIQPRTVGITIAKNF